MNTTDDILVITPCAGYVILHPLAYGHLVNIGYQEDYPEKERDKAKEWLLKEGWIGLAAGQITLEPDVTAYLESV
jgi:hypothetical protein